MIRLCQVADVPFVRELAVQSIVSSVPPTRDASPQQVQETLQKAYANLENLLMTEKNLAILVDEDDRTKELLGYIMLDFNHVESSTGERQVFIVDLAVRPDKRGHYATQHLMKKASQLARMRGIKYLVGMVSVSNERTLRLAQTKSLGFQIERHQIVKRCF